MGFDMPIFPQIIIIISNIKFFLLQELHIIPIYCLNNLIKESK